MLKLCVQVDRKGKVVPELKIHELRAETYNGMIRLLKPGCRTVVLIVDRYRTVPYSGIF